MADESKKPNGIRAEYWTRVATAVGGGLILAMQGVNISETNGQTQLIERVNKAMERQVELVQGVNKEGERMDQALHNQQQMIESMDMLLNNQNITLNVLQKETDGNRKPANGQ